MNATQGVLLPNPDDWTDAAGACRLLDTSRVTLFRLVGAGRITAYVLGDGPSSPRYWRAQVEELAAARKLAGRA